MTIVVGVDQTDGALAALRFALDEAGARATDLLVVTAWEVPYNLPYRSVGSFHELRAKTEHDAVQQAEQQVRTAQEQRVAPGPTVKVRAAEGIAEEVLLTAARDAELLVVGRNRGGLLRRLVLGSVSSRLVHEAECPVIVVPAPRPADGKLPYDAIPEQSAGGRRLPVRH